MKAKDEAEALALCNHQTGSFALLIGERFRAGLTARSRLVRSPSPFDRIAFLPLADSSTRDREAGGERVWYGFFDHAVMSAAAGS